MTTAVISLGALALLQPSPLLRRPPPTRRAALVRCSAAALTDEHGEPLTPDGGLRKLVLRDAEDGVAPSWGAMVSVQFTGRFLNGTVFDANHAEVPFEFQLNAGLVVDGMERGVKSMRSGEAARLTCSSRWAYGGAGVGSRIPPNATLVYDVELVSWREGPPVENQNFDMHTYRSALEGKHAGRGETAEYRWEEGGEEVTLYMPLRDGEGARDVHCDFRTRALTVRVGTTAGIDVTPAVREIAGELKGRAVPEDSYWVLDEARADGTRELQVVISKAGVYTRWDGVLIGEEEDAA